MFPHRGGDFDQSGQPYDDIYDGKQAESQRRRGGSWGENHPFLFLFAVSITACTVLLALQWLSDWLIP